MSAGKPHYPVRTENPVPAIWQGLTSLVHRARDCQDGTRIASANAIFTRTEFSVGTPDDFVAVAGYAEGCTNYICTAEAFEDGGYEPTASSVGPESERLLKAGVRRVLGPT